MKIDLVITAGNIHPHYTPLFQFVHKVWKERFNLDCYLVLVANEIPNYLKYLEKFIILWKPVEGMNNIYVAQVIRILYPALFYNKNVLITDLDILPVKYSYFIESIEDIPDDYFISYTNRYIKQKMLAVCYNLAKGRIWSEIFNIKTKKDIVEKLNKWYNIEYNGIKNCPGWYTDQKKLYKKIFEWSYFEFRVKILNDKAIGYNRLNNRARDKKKIVPNIDKICDQIYQYSDIHMIKPYSKVRHHIIKLVNAIIKLEFNQDK